MSSPASYKFRLYVAGGTQNSTEALTNLRAICARHLHDRHEIEVVDVLLDPKRAMVDGIRMTPSLIKLAPQPFRKIVGTLVHTKRVMLALGISDSRLEADSPGIER